MAGGCLVLVSNGGVDYISEMHRFFSEYLYLYIGMHPCSHHPDQDMRTCPSCFSVLSTSGLPSECITILYFLSYISALMLMNYKNVGL